MFVIVSNLITVLKYVMLLFLPLAFAGLPNIDFGFPGIDITLFGETFKWNIIGYDAAQEVFRISVQYMTAMLVGECTTSQSREALCSAQRKDLYRVLVSDRILYCYMYCKLNHCIWVAVAGMFVPGWLYNIGTTVLNGGVSMVVFFFVNKIIFPEGEAK